MKKYDKVFKSQIQRNWAWFDFDLKQKDNNNNNNNNNNKKLQIYIAQFPWWDDQLCITTIHGIK